MSIEELTYSYQWWKGLAEPSGLGRFLQFRKKYPHIIWLHPQPRPRFGTYWSQTFELLDQYFDMYQMSLDGLNRGIKKLMVCR